MQIKIKPGIPPDTLLERLSDDLASENCWSADLCGKLDICEVLLKPQNAVLKLVVKTQKPCDLRPLRAAILSYLPGIEEVVFAAGVSFEADALAEFLEAFWSDVVAEISVEDSLAAGLLKLSRPVVDDDRVYIEVKDEIDMLILKRRKCPAKLREIIRECTGFSLDLSLRVGDFQNEIKDLMDRAEAERIARHREKIREGEKKQKRKTPLLQGKKIEEPPVPVKDLNGEKQTAVIGGEVFSCQLRSLKSGKNLLIFEITDRTDSITCKVFLAADDDLPQQISPGDHLLVKGRVEFDTFLEEPAFFPRDINRTEPDIRRDEAEEKRVELHLHSKMSAMDSVLDLKELFSRLSAWGHEHVAITDHGVLQAFPEAYELAAEHGITPIFGTEAYLIDDGKPVITRPPESRIEAESYVIFDLETTGLSPISDEIIEIGAVRIEGGQVVDQFSTFVRPSGSIPKKITELTGIEAQDVRDAPRCFEVLDRFWNFAEGAILVAHNADFDMGFINFAHRELDREPPSAPVLDTLSLARLLLPDQSRHRLSDLIDHFNIEAGDHHRALDDSQMTAAVFKRFLSELKKRGIIHCDQLNDLIHEIDHRRLTPFHATVLVQNQTGLKNLYRLVSLAHTDYFYRQPRIKKSELEKMREGLLIGSACERGEVFRALLNGREENELYRTARFYDYLEIQPLANNEFLIEDGQLSSQREIEVLNERILDLGRKLDIPVVATCDVHYLDPEDAIFREILQAGQGYEDFSDSGVLYLRTTEEMLGEFAYLDEDVACEVVIENPRTLAEMTEEIRPVPAELHPPEIPGADEEIKELVTSQAFALYGRPLPGLVKKRMERELDAIIENDFAVLYLISHRLVKKSLEDGYLVGSRGSVGSSFVAFLCSITEVNPLQPHYRCPDCTYSDFNSNEEAESGFDLPQKTCPDCGAELNKDGHNIPFEVFLGFEGDKVPDIDLNFSGEYQSQIHQYTEKLFGEKQVYRAGTISTIAKKTAFGFVKGYLTDRGEDRRTAEVNRLVEGLSGVKRTTGQHPGGLMVVPKTKDIYDFTPIQYPANDRDSEVITTHFDYHAISSRLVKLDLLGHDDPTSIRMLQDLTGVLPQEIPMDDPQTLRLFSSPEPLDLSAEEAGTSVGTLGIPEFGTGFVRQMLEDTHPETFAGLVRISGLSHGTDVWLNNAQDLIASGAASLPEVISARDDIMNFLIEKGVQPRDAFAIMENVRKGRGVSEREEKLMRKAQVPGWYIDSCKKIKYMFPKAHAVAYVMMAFRIAYFKVHHPLAFYAVYFTIKGESFDYSLVKEGQEGAEKQISELEAKGNEATARDRKLLAAGRVALEAMKRGYSFAKVDLYKSDPYRCLLVDDKLLPPLISLAGLGRTAALNIATERKKARFTSIEDLRRRTGINKNVLEILTDYGTLSELPETDQLTLFKNA